MIELTPLTRIMDEYRTLLKRYESNLEDLNVLDYKKMLGEIKLFWYRKQKYVNYFISHITEEDKVAFLAGAVRLDIKNGGHFEYILVGKIRLINDPFLKMLSFYNATEKEINFEYTNKYLKECIQDVLAMFREYPNDFYIFPIEFIKTAESNEYHFALVEASDKMILSMFSVEYNDVQEFYANNASYEDIEHNLLPYVKEQLIFEGLEDIKLPLRDRCNNYLNANGNIMPIMKQFNEAQVFFMLVSQYCMQAIAIISAMENYHIIPFIRNDVTFQYFTMIFYSNIFTELDRRSYLNVYIPYVIQNAFDFSDKGYMFVKEHMGNGKLISIIANSFEESSIPRPSEIIKCVEAYINCY